MHVLLYAPTVQLTAAPLSINLLGPPQIALAGAPLTLPRRQMRALLYRLAVAQQPVPRDPLCFLFWPDIADTAARRNLTVLLNQLRQALPAPTLLQTQPDLIQLDPAHIQTDTVAFANAVDLYTGPFLDGFSLPASAEFDSWVIQERQSWARRYLDALTILVDGYADRADPCPRRRLSCAPAINKLKFALECQQFVTPIII